MLKQDVTMIKKIVSGSQTGAEQAARDVAAELGIPHELGGSPSSGCPQPIEENVMGTDGTLVISHGKLSGEPARTVEFANRREKACLHIDLNVIRGFSAAQFIKAWISIHDLDILNVTGPCAENDPEIYEDTARLLKAVHHLFFIETKTSDPDNLQPLFPRTVEAAVDRLFFELPFKDKARIAKLKADELELLYPTLGIYVLEEYGLRYRAGELMKDCRFMAKDRDLDADAAAVLIIKELWKKLRKTHALRVVQ